MFRDDFVWGVAASAYQTEGRDVNDGAGISIWDTLLKKAGLRMVLMQMLPAI